MTRMRQSSNLRYNPVSLASITTTGRSILDRPSCVDGFAQRKSPMTSTWRSADSKRRRLSATSFLSACRWASLAVTASSRASPSIPGSSVFSKSRVYAEILGASSNRTSVGLRPPTRRIGPTNQRRVPRRQSHSSFAPIRRILMTSLLVSLLGRLFEGENWTKASQLSSPFTAARPIPPEFRSLDESWSLWVSEPPETVLTASQLMPLDPEAAPIQWRFSSEFWRWDRDNSSTTLQSASASDLACLDRCRLHLFSLTIVTSSDDFVHLDFHDFLAEVLFAYHVQHESLRCVPELQVHLISQRCAWIIQLRNAFLSVVKSTSYFLVATRLSIVRVLIHQRNEVVSELISDPPSVIGPPILRDEVPENL